MMKGRPISPYLLIAALGALLFLPMLGSVHLFDWDEINFAESAREMLVTGEYGRVTINFQPFWEKPPLFIWLQAISMKVFGINEFAARLPNALCGIATLLVLFFYGKKYRNAAFGWFWVLVYVGTWLPHIYFKSGIIDPVFNLFMFLGVVQLAKWAESTERKPQLVHAALSGLFVGLAVLTKGPVGLLLPGLAALLFMIVKRRWFLGPLPLLLALVVFFVSTFAWYGVETVRNGWWFLGEFVEYNFRLALTEDSGHGGFLGYHFVVLLLGCFPASLLLFYKPRQAPLPDEGQARTLQHLHVWMWLLLAVVLVVFTIVQTKIVHYSSLAYFPITFLAASTLYKWQDIMLKTPKTLIVGLAVGVGIFGVALMGGTYFLSMASGMAKVSAAIAQGEVEVAMSPWPVYYVFIGVLFTVWAGTGIWSMWKGELLAGIIRVFIVTAVALQLLYILVLPKVEPLTQGVMVAFLKEQAKEEVYVNVIGFKSYAHYYYAQKQPEDLDSPHLQAVLEQYKQEHNRTTIPPADFNLLELGWHLNGKIDKPVVFVARARKSKKIQSENPQLKRLGAAGGFVFFRREVE